MTAGLNEVFTLASVRSGEAQRSTPADGKADFIWQAEQPGVVDLLLGAVAGLRSFWAERDLHPCVVAARSGVDAVIIISLRASALWFRRMPTISMPAITLPAIACPMILSPWAWLTNSRAR